MLNFAPLNQTRKDMETKEILSKYAILKAIAAKCQSMIDKANEEATKACTKFVEEKFNIKQGDNIKIKVSHVPYLHFPKTNKNECVNGIFMKADFYSSWDGTESELEDNVVVCLATKTGKKKQKIVLKQIANIEKM